MIKCYKEIIQSLINILDPIDIYEICPEDEYFSEANEIEDLSKKKEYDQKNE